MGDYNKTNGDYNKEMDNYYQLLNINNNASFENINLAYENAISKYNNLTFLLPQQISEIKKLKTALYILTNPELKNKYDNKLSNIKPYNIDNEDDFDSVFKIDNSWMKDKQNITTKIEGNVISDRIFSLSHMNSRPGYSNDIDLEIRKPQQGRPEKNLE
jgi:DnaJ-class molecular chaperone